jgi:hypothetical protein
MAEFVNDTSGLLDPWGGYEPCAIVADYVLPGKAFRDMMIRCSVLTTGPLRGQTYCHCDFGLVGPGCAEITSGSVYRIVIFIIAATFAALAIPNGVYEIYRQSKPLKVNPVYVSLWLALTGGVFIVLWGVLGVYCILGAASGADLSAAREFFLNGAIPGGVVFPFAAAMIVSLAWRKVVVSSGLHIDDNKRVINKRENRYHNLVVILCIAMFVLIAFLSVAVSVSAALLLLVLVNLIGGFFFYRSGKAFQHNMATMFEIDKTKGKKGKMTPVEQSLRAASKANKLVIIGMYLVVFGSVLSILAGNLIGVPSVVGQFQISSIPIALIAIGVGTSEAAIVLYSRQVRMIGVKRRKKLQLGKTVSGKLFSTVSSAKGIGGVGNNKVAPDI